MKNFVINFTRSEGSSAIITTLKKFPQIDIIGFEPFDAYQFKNSQHNGKGKDISLNDLKASLNLVFSRAGQVDDYEKLLAILQKYKEIKFPNAYRFSPGNAKGFKMRLSHAAKERWAARDKILDIMAAHEVVQFVLIRSDIFMWSLSCYKPPDIQFKIARGKMAQKDIQAMYYDPQLYKKALNTCIELYKNKFDMLHLARKRGVKSVPILYEDFCDNKALFFEDMLQALDIRIEPTSLKKTIEEPHRFKKVHSTDPKEIVANYDEIWRIFRRKKKEIPVIDFSRLKVLY